MNLQQLRSEVNIIDVEILSLLNKRATLTLYIGDEKRKQQKHIKDKNREQRILHNVTANNNGPLSDQQIRTIFESIINSCRTLQERNRKGRSW